MKPSLVCLFALAAASLQAADLSQPIEVLRAVQKVTLDAKTCRAVRMRMIKVPTLPSE